MGACRECLPPVVDQDCKLLRCERAARSRVLDRIMDNKMQLGLLEVPPFVFGLQIPLSRYCNLQGGCIFFPVHPKILPFCDLTKSVLHDLGQIDAMSLNSLTSRQQATTRGCRAPAAAAANVPRPAVAPVVNRAAGLVSSSSCSPVNQQQQVAPIHRRQQQPARLVACAAAAAEKGACGVQVQQPVRTVYAC